VTGLDLSAKLPGPLFRIYILYETKRVLRAQAVGAATHLYRHACLCDWVCRSTEQMAREYHCPSGAFQAGRLLEVHLRVKAADCVLIKG
jgi:hypothetical protein